MANNKGGVHAARLQFRNDFRRYCRENNIVIKAGAIQSGIIIPDMMFTKETTKLNNQLFRHYK